MLRPLLQEHRLTYSVSNTECPIKGEVDVRISKNDYKKIRAMTRFTLKLRHIAGHEEDSTTLTSRRAPGRAGP